MRVMSHSKRVAPDPVKQLWQVGGGTTRTTAKPDAAVKVRIQCENVSEDPADLQQLVNFCGPIPKTCCIC